MTLTYEQARDVVERELKPTWNHGTFCIDDRKINETDAYYSFVVGAKEFLVDGDREYEAIGGLTVVYKDDARVDVIASVEVVMNPTLRTRENPNPTFVSES